MKSWFAVPFLEDVTGHFTEQQIHFVLDSTECPDTDLPVQLMIHWTKRSDRYVQFMSFSQMILDKHLQKTQDEDKNLLLIIFINNQKDKHAFESYDFGKNPFEGVWFLPEYVKEVKTHMARFDSQIYTYAVKETGPSIIINELFSIKKKYHFVNHIGNWTMKDGLIIEIPHLWDRRTMFLRGIPLRGVHLKWTPFTFIEEKNGTRYSYGIISEIMKLFQVHLYSYIAAAHKYYCLLD